MPRYKTFDEIFEELKEVIIEHKLTIDDFSDNVDSDGQMIRAIFDNSNDVIGTISRIFKLCKINIFTKQLKFKMYHITDGGTQTKIKRVLHPKCEMYYDKATAKYYKFNYDLLRDRNTATQTEAIKNEMRMVNDEYIQDCLIGKYNE